jgi:hypothetical protein
MKENYQKKILSQRLSSPEHWKSLALNADTLQALLDQFLPKRQRDEFFLGSFLKDLLDVGITMGDLVKDIEKAEDVVQRFESQIGVGTPSSQVGALKMALAGTNPKWTNYVLESMREKPSPGGWSQIPTDGSWGRTKT